MADKEIVLYQMSVFGLRIVNNLPETEVVTTRQTFSTYGQAFDYLYYAYRLAQEQGRAYTGLLVNLNGADFIFVMEKNLKPTSFK